VRNFQNPAPTFHTAIVRNGMAGRHQGQAMYARFSPIRNVHQSAADATSKYALDCAGHRSACLARADDLYAIEIGKLVASSSGSERTAIKLEMAQNRSVGIGGCQSGLKNLEGVFAHVLEKRQL
jgi:hypothetical protein